MGIVAGYQSFGNTNGYCMHAAARLKDIENMMVGCGDYLVMHSWRDQGNTGDDHCIGVWEWGGQIAVTFWANWAPMNGWFESYSFPKDHEIYIGFRPNHAVGSREYDSFTWWVHDKTTDEYAETTKSTPETWIGKAMDVALEMVTENTPNGLKRGCSDIICLNEHNNEVQLSNVSGWCEWDHPTIINNHEEFYTDNGYKAECIQWKTIEGLEDMVLNINSDPQGQEVLIDGVSVGVTPTTETVSCEEHNIMVQPSGIIDKPDLQIEDIWVGGSVINYRIRNTGEANAGASHTKLIVDGVVKETKYESGLNSGNYRNETFSFNWECSGDNDTIEVVADYNGEVDESNEGNNSLEKVITCDSGCVGIDLTPIEIFEQYGKVAYKIKNQGTQAVPNMYNSHCVFLKSVGDGSFKYTGFNRASSHAAGAIKTYQSYVPWPVTGTQIKIRTNCSNAYIDCNPANNEMIVTA